MEDDIAYIGMRHVWGGSEPFGLSPEDRRHHTYVIGKTGTGKSTLLRNLLVQDIYHGRGVGLIDPHGDLAEALLDQIPPWRINHVVYFNPADREYPVGFNLLRAGKREEAHLIASGAVSAFKNIWRDSWGPRLEYLLYAGIAALAECENASLLGLPRMLIDDVYRQWVVKQIKDSAVKAFWEREFAGYDKRFVSEVIAPVQNKVGQLLMAPPLRHILGQVRSTIDFRFVMDKEQIFIANLSKGRLGEDKANLLGALLVTQFQLAAMARADIPEEKRKDFQLVVDEFQNFATDSFTSILAEARKYRLCLTLSHQYLKQVREEIRDAVFGNVGTLIGFTAGGGDAPILANEFGGEFHRNHFTELPRHEICVRNSTSGAITAPFNARALAPLPVKFGKGEVIIAQSRQRFTKQKKVVEQQLKLWQH